LDLGMPMSPAGELDIQACQRVVEYLNSKSGHWFTIFEMAGPLGLPCRTVRESCEFLEESHRIDRQESGPISVIPKYRCRPTALSNWTIATLRPVVWRAPRAKSSWQC
jgi:hypothetical protein